MTAPPADPMHGYTLADLDALAFLVVRAHQHWWSPGTWDDQRMVAWEAMAEMLAASDERPSRTVLMLAGRDAVSADVRAHLRQHGRRGDGASNGSAFTRYWESRGWERAGHDEAVTDAVAAWQVLAALTPRQQEAVRALADTGDYVAAALSLGLSRTGYSCLINAARREFRELWHEGEAPSGQWRPDRRVTARPPRDAADAAARAGYAARKRETRKAA